MSINEIIVWIMMIFMLIAALDRVFDQFGGAEKVLGKIGLKGVAKHFAGVGKEFEEGFMAMGSLALSMVGMMAFAPVLAGMLQGVLAPLYTSLGANPAMFAGTLLAIDMGGFNLAQQLSNGDNAAWMYSGVMLASMMGATVVFSIPVGLGIIQAKDQRFLATGILAGMVAIPVGCIIGGVVAMFSGIKTASGELVEFTFSMLIMNMIPVFIVAILIVIGLKLAQNGMIKGFQIFAKCLVALITVALACAVFESQTGVGIIPGMDPIFAGFDDFTLLKTGEIVKDVRAIETIGSIACILLGAYPMVFLLTRWFKQPLMKFGRVLKVNESAIAGMIATLANNIPMFGMLHRMDDRGKVLNVAFAVCAAFALGDHLGFAAAVAPDMITPMIIGKVSGGIFAIFVATFFAPKGSVKKGDATTESEVAPENIDADSDTNKGAVDH